MKISSILILFFFVLSLNLKAQEDIFKEYKVVYNQNFSSSKSTKDFEFSDEDKWLISKNGKPGKSLKCLGTGDFKSKHDGPAIVAVLKDFVLKDFVVEMDVLQNGKDYNLLDFCIFFGVKDTEHYCYAQVASKADKKSHNIFMVNADKPERIAKVQDKGVFWGMKKWQHIRMERVSSTKSIKVFFNDTLVLETSDDAFEEGHIGFGSSNSALKIDNLELSAPNYKSETKTFF